MKVVILCGGKGWRLHEETEFRPKPLVRVGNMPILWHIMKIYAFYGHNDFILCLGYKGEMIKDYFLNLDETSNDFSLKLCQGSKEVIFHNKKKLIDDWNITFVDTGLDTQTGGRVARIKEFIGDDEDFFLTYGDGVSDININEIFRYHKQKGKVATLCGVNYINPFGIIHPEEGLVKFFQEKPRSKDSFINGGFYVFNRKVFSYLSKEEDCVLEREPLENLAKEGQLAIYAHHGFWHCLDHMKHLNELNDMHNSGNRPWVLWEKEKSS